MFVVIDGSKRCKLLTLKVFPSFDLDSCKPSHRSPNRRWNLLRLFHEDVATVSSGSNRYNDVTTVSHGYFLTDETFHLCSLLQGAEVRSGLHLKSL